SGAPTTSIAPSMRSKRKARCSPRPWSNPDTYQRPRAQSRRCGARRRAWPPEPNSILPRPATAPHAPASPASARAAPARRPAGAPPEREGRGLALEALQPHRLGGEVQRLQLVGGEVGISEVGLVALDPVTRGRLWVGGVRDGLHRQAHLADVALVALELAAEG